MENPMHSIAVPRARARPPRRRAPRARGVWAGRGNGSAKGGSATVTTQAGDESATVTIEAHDVYFDPSDVTAPAGEISFALIDEGSQTHTFLIEGEDDFRLSVTTSDKDDSGILELDAGEYTFYCDIPGHRAQGMEGTLTLA